jgi:succinoglycan biosynthesis protein ExoO
MPPDISVIIAAYNVEAYIERAVKSALEQENVTVDVIIVNDASTDGTLAALSRIDDPRVKFLNLPANGGPSVARNAGIAAATAPWIAILDGDDIFLPGRLARCLFRAKALLADIVVDNIEIYREADGKRSLMFPPVKFSRFVTLDLATFIAGNQSFLGGAALGYLKPILSTEFLRRHTLTYDPDLRIGEDYLLLAEALAKGARCAVEAAVGYLYTVRAGSISHRLALIDIERIAETDKKFLAHNPLTPAATQAQKRRTRRLEDARAFTKLVNAIKQRDSGAALKAIAARPAAIWYLWRPVWVRIARLFKRPRN